MKKEGDNHSISGENCEKRNVKDEWKLISKREKEKCKRFL